MGTVARVEMKRVAPTVEREIRTMRKCFVTLGLVLVVGISAWGPDLRPARRGRQL